MRRVFLVAVLVISSIVALVPLFAFGGLDSSAAQTAPHVTTTLPILRPSPAAAAAREHAAALKRWYDAVRWNLFLEAIRAQNAARWYAYAAAHQPYASGQCGGSLPPCYVKMRESRGDIRIWNGNCYAPYGYLGYSSPCGGSTASGKWQILRTSWQRFDGYTNAADAPESVQDARARIMWAGGGGCSAWAAC